MAQVSHPFVSVIVVNYNAGDLIQRCIRALLAQSFQDFEVLVVDNASSDGSVDTLAQFGERIRLIENQRNLGFAVANNQAAQQASGRWLATLNPDAFPEPRWLERLMQAVRRYPGVACFGSTLRDAREPALLDGAGDPYHAFGFAWRGAKGQALEQLPAEGSVFGPCAAAALYRRDLFLRLGGFDERFFCYYEDVDLAFRIRLAGSPCIQMPDAVVGHVGSAISGSHSDFSVYHITRNRIWTFFKNMPLPLLLPLLLPMLGILANSLLARPSRAKWRALGDAFRGLGPVWSDRRRQRPLRRAGSAAIARALTWSLQLPRRAAPDVRPWPPEPTLEGSGEIWAIVVTYEADHEVLEGLQALLRQLGGLVVVDNGSDTAMLESLEQLARDKPGRVELLFNGENLGLARAQNQGIEQARGLGRRWLLFMDQDSVPRPGMVQALVNAYNGELRDRPVGLLAPALDREGMRREQSYAVSRHALHLGRHRFGRQPVLHDLAFVIASGSLVSMQVLDSVGGMRDDYFIDYVDVEFCLRLRERGYDILAVRDALLFHRLGETEEQRLGPRTVSVTHHSAQRRYYIYRNRTRLWRHYLLRRPAWVGFDMLASLQEVVKILFHEQERRVKLRNVLRGVYEGLKGG